MRYRAQAGTGTANAPIRDLGRRLAAGLLMVPVMSAALYTTVTAQQTQTMSVRGRALGDTTGARSALEERLDTLLSRNTDRWDATWADSVTRLTQELKQAQCADTLHATWWVTSTGQARCLWLTTGPGAFSLANVAFSTNRGSIYAELLATTFGTLRASLGTMVSATDEADAGPQETVQRVIAGGGNLVLGLQRPLQVVLSGGNRTLSVFGMAARFAADFPEMGADVQDPAVNGAVSVDWQLSVKSDDEALELFGQVHGELLHGSADFYRGLGVASRSCCYKYVQASIGGVVWNSFVITWSKVLGGSDPLKSLGGQISVTARRQDP